MRTYASSRVNRKSFYRKSELQMFLLISGGHIGGPKRSTNMVSPYKARSTKLRETFRQITQKLWATKICHETWTNCLYISLLQHFIFLAYCLNLFLYRCFSLLLHSIMCYVKHVCLTKLTSMDYVKW